MMKRGEQEIVGELKNARMRRIDDFELAFECFMRYLSQERCFDLSQERKENL
jgi:hypothetical protein